VVGIVVALMAGFYLARTTVRNAPTGAQRQQQPLAGRRCGGHVGRSCSSGSSSSLWSISGSGAAGGDAALRCIPMPLGRHPETKASTRYISKYSNVNTQLLVAPP